MRTHRAVATVTAVTLAATLTGCAATSTEPATPAVEAAQDTPEPEPTEEPVVEETPEPEPTEETGPTYTLTDGTTVTINPNEPLPQAVIADITATSPAKGHQSQSAADNPAQQAGLVATQERIEALGKTPILISHGAATDINGQVTSRFFVVVAPMGDPLFIQDAARTVFQDAGGALREAQGRIAASDDPNRYALIDLT